MLSLLLFALPHLAIAAPLSSCSAKANWTVVTDHVNKGMGTVPSVDAMAAGYESEEFSYIGNSALNELNWDGDAEMCLYSSTTCDSQYDVSCPPRSSLQESLYPAPPSPRQ